MRAVTLRSTAGLLVLLLAMLVHTALGPILACHATAVDQPVATVAAVTAVPEDASVCPGCLLEPPVGAERPSAHPTTTDVPSSADPCTPDQPCQHSAGERNPGSDAAVRGLDAPRDHGPAVVTECVESAAVEPPTAPTSASDPVLLAAVRAPVAVLCVDRN